MRQAMKEEQGHRSIGLCSHETPPVIRRAVLSKQAVSLDIATMAGAYHNELARITCCRSSHFLNDYLEQSAHGIGTGAWVF